jgi:hypothetical protein
VVASVLSIVFTLGCNFAIVRVYFGRQNHWLLSGG